ncbi:uncharacterized protein NEMAJ01_0079 [Nematocida major]|uniref:uncharacterized protein n=1 Tax=Nematocida major TaxID=1912982 RepID=UPI0020073A3D|nr:uncharacterized protein NEMAJ01_0079 [Nematocida major]KAH9385183.1 hypothetical protein NEMAJ01_0079 [Nematocida major]
MKKCLMIAGVLFYGRLALSTEAVVPSTGVVTDSTPKEMSGEASQEGRYARIEKQATEIEEKIVFVIKNGNCPDEEEANAIKEQIQNFISNVRNTDTLFKQNAADTLSLKKDQTSKWTIISKGLQGGFIDRFFRGGHKFSSSNLSPQEKKESEGYMNFLSILNRIAGLTESTTTVFQKAGKSYKEEMPIDAGMLSSTIQNLLRREYILGILERIGAGKSQPDSFKNVLSEPKSAYSEIILETFNLQKMLNKKLTPAESVLQADAIFETLLDTFLVHEYRIIQEVHKKDSSLAKMEYLSPIWEVLIQEINALEDHAIIHKDGREKVVSRIMNCLDALSRHMLKIHPVLSGIIDPTKKGEGIFTLSLLEDQTLGNLEMNSPDLDEVAIGKWLGIRGDASYMEGIASSVSKKTGSALETITSRLPRLFWDNSAAWEKSLLEGIPAGLADKKREDLKSLEMVLKNSVKILQAVSNYLVQEYTVVSQTPVLAPYGDEPNSSLDKAKEAIEILQKFPTFACYLEKANFLRRENTPGRRFCPEFMALAVNEVQQFQMFVNRNSEETNNPTYISFLTEKKTSAAVLGLLHTTALHICIYAFRLPRLLPKTGKEEALFSLKNELNQIEETVQSLSPRASVNASFLANDMISSLNRAQVNLDKISFIDGNDMFLQTLSMMESFHLHIDLLKMYSSNPGLFSPYAEVKFRERLSCIRNAWEEIRSMENGFDAQEREILQRANTFLSRPAPSAPSMDLLYDSNEREQYTESEIAGNNRLYPALHEKNNENRHVPLYNQNQIEDQRNEQFEKHDEKHGEMQRNEETKIITPGYSGSDSSYSSESSSDSSSSEKTSNHKVIFIFCAIAAAVGGGLAFFLWKRTRKTRGTFFK